MARAKAMGEELICGNLSRERNVVCYEFEGVLIRHFWGAKNERGCCKKKKMTERKKRVVVN